jgi:hypothetical protein
MNYAIWNTRRIEGKITRTEVLWDVENSIVSDIGVIVRRREKEILEEIKTDHF